LTIRDSRIMRNRADLVTTWPIRGQGELIQMGANGGGIHVGDGSEVLIDHTQIVGNSILGDDQAGEPGAIDSAVLINNSHLVMRHTEISHNTVVVNAATADDFGSSGPAVELDGAATITDTRIIDNPVYAFSENSSAAASSGLGVFDFTGNPGQVSLRRVVISGNSSLARSPHGSALVNGGGILNNSLLDLQDVQVQGNSGIAHAPKATAQGGGIWNGVLFSGPPVVLTLTNTQVTRNALEVSAGGTAQGGGIFTTEPVAMRDSRLANNVPDQCFGCTAIATANNTLSVTSTTIRGNRH
jgi:hypothetical protein